jgi:glycosyltransferase involved in cell wall biosynthesis
MPPDLPALSVIVPVFNGAGTLPDALASILNQSGAAIEIVVVDDGSTDASADVARACVPEVVCVRQDNRGPAAARNRGLQLARGEFVSFLDADDLWPPGRVQEHLRIFAQSPEIELVIGTTRMRHLAPPPRGTEMALTPVPMIQHQLGSITCRRGVFDRIGHFDPALLRGEDSDWFGRALRAGVAIHMTRAVAVEYRMREGSLTYGTLGHMRWFLVSLRANLQARRRRDQAAVANDNE